MNPHNIDDSPAKIYLHSLTMRLLEGAEKLPAHLRDRHVRYLNASQNPDGGYSGRAGGSDLYYTGFALRALAMLQSLDMDRCTRTANFLTQRIQQPASAIDLFSFLVSSVLVTLGGGTDVLAAAPADWRDRVSATLEAHRTPDGGYAKLPNSPSGSTYHTFLIALAYQILERPLPNLDQAITFILSRRRDDGGFVEIAPMRRSGANPTAAAIGFLETASAITPEIRTSVVDFFAGLVSEFEGGYRANDRIPTADLLSTFTVVWSLLQMNGGDRIDLEAVRSYVLSLEAKAGGFQGGLWDNAVDVEYTFYGLGTLAALAGR
ncbi:prenyltransferase/squalene oxidase repeat-containing protein [Tuwongella immobilis]